MATFSSIPTGCVIYSFLKQYLLDLIYRDLHRPRLDPNSSPAPTFSPPNGQLWKNSLHVRIPSLITI